VDGYSLLWEGIYKNERSHSHKHVYLGNDALDHSLETEPCTPSAILAYPGLESRSFRTQSTSMFSFNVKVISARRQIETRHEAIALEDCPETNTFQLMPRDDNILLSVNLKCTAFLDLCAAAILLKHSTLHEIYFTNSNQAASEMAPLNRIIIDTDPGIDDVFAILLALSAKAEELEVVLISVTFGNVEVRSCLRNVVAIFQILEKELQWRQENGKLEGFEGMTKYKPIVAVGASEPLHEQLLMADYFHGLDGLAGIHESHPHLSPHDTWQKLFARPPPDTVISGVVDDSDLAEGQSSFRPSLVPAYKEILRVLRENEADTITIVAVGPLTNLALAAAEDTKTFLRVKEVVSMGGAIDLKGNVCSPTAPQESIS